MILERSMQTLRSAYSLLFAGLAGAVLASSAATAEDAETYYPPVETHLIPSKFVKQTYKVQVMRPAQKRGETTRFPVVYVTDGNLVFDMFKGISYLIQSPAGVRFILVGIGYPSDSPQAGALLRARDLTFPGYPKLVLKRPPIEGALAAEPGTKDFMGAPEFQQFIAQELIPLIDREYPTVPGDRTYFGHSGGGGFGLYTLFNKTDLFKRYIISSPGLIYNGVAPGGAKYDNYEFALEEARKFMAGGRSLDGVKIYMSAGSAEEFEPGLAQWQLTSSVYRMERLLRASSIPGLDLTTEIFPGETHATVWPLAFMHGVQAVFETGMWKKKEAAAGAK